MSKKNVFLSVLAVIILAGGVFAGIKLVGQQQELREKAAVPNGIARVSLFPTTGNFKVGDTLPVSIYFNTSGIAISSIKLRLVYPFSGTTPEISASKIEINNIIEQSGSWNCPTKEITSEGQNIAIDIACANISAQGYATSSDTLFATFNLTVNRIPSTNPFSLKFDPSLSIITQKSNGQDILSIPDSETGTAVFTVETTTGPTPTPTKVPTATPTSKLTPTPTKVVTPTPTVKLTATPTAKTTLTPSPVEAVELPDAGYALPSYIGLGLGFILIISAILLAI